MLKYLNEKNLWKKKKEPPDFLCIAWILCGFGSHSKFSNLLLSFLVMEKMTSGEVKVPTQNWRPYSEMWFPLKVKACLSCIYRWPSNNWAAIIVTIILHTWYYLIHNNEYLNKYLPLSMRVTNLREEIKFPKSH